MKLSELSDEDEPSLELSFATSFNPILVPTYFAFMPFSIIWSSNMADLATVITTSFGIQLKHQSATHH